MLLPRDFALRYVSKLGSCFILFFMKKETTFSEAIIAVLFIILSLPYHFSLLESTADAMMMVTMLLGLMVFFFLRRNKGHRVAENW